MAMVRTIYRAGTMAMVRTIGLGLWLWLGL